MALEGIGRRFGPRLAGGMAALSLLAGTLASSPQESLPPAHPPPTHLPREVTVRFEGGLASANYAEMIVTLGGQNLLPLKVHVDHKGGTPAEIMALTGRLVGPTVAWDLEDYLCEINRHVCRRTKGFEWRNVMAPSGAPEPPPNCPTPELPRYALCLPDVSVREYRGTVVLPFNPARESLERIVREKGGCAAFDEPCRRTIRGLNKDDVLAPTFPGGKVRVPVLAYSVSFPVSSAGHLDRLVQAVEVAQKKLADRGALTLDRRSLYVTVPTPVQKQESGPAPSSDLDALTPLTHMQYPFLPPNAFPPNFPQVLVGVWDYHVDRQHCGFGTGPGRAIIEADNRPFNAAEDPPLPPKQDGCGSSRQPLEDRWDHGTHVTGVIAARGQGPGRIGVNPRAVMWTYETDSKGLRFERDDDPFVKLARKLAESGAPPAQVAVVNLSFTLRVTDQPTRVESLIESYREDTLFVAAAGNDDKEIRHSGQCRFMPACMTADRDSPAAENVISVVALNRTGLARWTHPTEPKGSNYGPVFDVAAVGEAMSTLYGNAYGILQGTSVATPFVTGLASLIQANARTKFPRQTKERILYTVDFSDDLDALVHFGRINFRRALALGRDLVTPKGCATANCELQPVEVRKSSSDDLRIAEGQRDGRELERPITLKPRQIRRLTAKDDSGGSPYWVVYVDEGGRLRKIREARFEGTPQFRLRSGEARPVSGLRDYVCAMKCQDPS